MHHSDVLHPNRANVSKDDLRGKLAELYKCTKDQINVFGLQTQFGGGKTTGFALVYDSPEALKKFEPHFRLVRVGAAEKIEKPSRAQRTSTETISRIRERLYPGRIRVLTLIQAINARTGSRPSAERRRSRDPRRRRRHKLFTLCWSIRWFGCWVVLEDRHRVFALHRSPYVVVAEIKETNRDMMA